MKDQPQQQITQALDEQARDLDGNTLSRLHQARARALEEHTRKRANGFAHFLLGAGSIAALALVAVLQLPPLEEPSLPLQADRDALEIATLNVDLEVIEDLDFYEWLSLQDLEAIPERKST